MYEASAGGYLDAGGWDEVRDWRIDQDHLDRLISVPGRVSGFAVRIVATFALLCRWGLRRLELGRSMSRGSFRLSRLWTKRELMRGRHAVVVSLMCEAWDGMCSSASRLKAAVFGSKECCAGWTEEQ